MCGEQQPGLNEATRDGGSSPRVRGTAKWIVNPGLPPRFIPACAGNRLEQIRIHLHSPVHPRVCGEQGGIRRGSFLISGSSPRVRGTVTRTLTRQICLRFIPACAGNSPGFCVGHIQSPVHPRVCGEQMRSSTWLVSVRGSSPRVRGTEWYGTTNDAVARFIPACAGNSFQMALVIIHLPVHPRVCGEQQRHPLIIVLALGSSPRVRGTAGNGLFHVRILRFIPACAGNSARATCRAGHASVHPRVCGEQSPVPAHLNANPGSSPRVRGTVFGSSKSHGALRFIPACAGNSTPIYGDDQH